jgi:TRAP-type C4-dicarboxylate transport system permease small subunit
VPLVVAASVLLAIAEQELRAHTLTPRLHRWLLWTPRLLMFLFVAFLAIFSLEVFVEGRSAQEVALGLLMHNLPALALLAAGLLAWRWPLAGALGLTAFVVWWLPMTLGHGFFLTVFLLLAALPLAGAALLWLNWMLRIPPRRTT